MTANDPLAPVRLKNGQKEARIVVDRFMESLRRLHDDNSTYRAFMELVRFCRDDTYNMSSESQKILDEMGFIEKTEGRIVVSQSLRNITTSAATGEGLMTTLESPYADED